jgi:peptide/nickel transport system permease protein
VKRKKGDQSLLHQLGIKERQVLSVARRKKNTLTKQIWHRLMKDKLAVISLIILLIVFIIAFLAPWILPYEYSHQDLSEALQYPSLKHPFGTDNFGRDLFSRVLYGSRYTLMIGFGCGTGAMIIGVLIGVLAGTNKKVDMVIMRFIDIIMGIPAFTLALMLVITMGKNLGSIMIALAITAIPNFARIVRVQVLSVSENEYIEAAIASGASKSWIIMRHILPNSFAAIIVQYTYQVVNLIMTGASLSFIGMGIQAPMPEWGLMISQGRSYLRDYWYMSILPGVALIVVTYALNLIGDGLRDALDPRLKQ